jgi:uncharacterized membrane protein YgcG
MRPSLFARGLVLVAGLALLAAPIAADEGWLIERLDITYDVQRDGSISVAEAIDVDFRGLAKHGIFRDVARRQGYDETRYRTYDIRLGDVRSADGRRYRVDVQGVGDLERFKIGDPNKVLSGRQTYRLTYRLGGALNAQADHDEFYWNGTGTWPVAIAQASIVVRAPDDGIERVACFEGRQGSNQPCNATFAARQATFRATRPLREGEQLTIVTSFRKGLVTVPPPRLSTRPRNVLHSFDSTPSMLAAMMAGFLLTLGGVGAIWWRWGRDRRFVALVRSSSETAEERVPLLGGRPIAVEFEPPEKLRPGQMGLLLDERADTLDVTATIIDLAVRGYLKITEIEKAHWFSSRDWQLDRLKAADAELLEYERIVLDGLFAKGTPTTISALKNKFYSDLAKAKKALYTDAVERGWFPANPNTVRTLWRLAGIVALSGGVALTIWIGAHWGAGLLGLPVIAGGAVLAMAAGAMPRRSALGRDLTRRTLGFLRYIKTAEVGNQAFAERANLFTEYLPYAVAFKCVERWAHAFQGIDLQAATAGWYSGTSGFNIGTFSSSMSSFSSSVSSTIASTPGGSGGSGFSGGSSGGGGGGGGGGSW